MNFKFLSKVHQAVIGPTGSGKSYFVGFIAEKLYEQEIPFIIFDTKTKNHIGLIQLKKVKLLKIKPNTVYDFKRMLDYDYILAIPTRSTTTKELIAQYLRALKTIFNSGRPYVIILEEAHNYAETTRKPYDVVELITREGRSSGQNCIFVTQRILDFPKILWANCYLSYIFKALIPNDINYIAQMIPNFQELNRQLKKYHVLEYDHLTHEYRVIEPWQVQRKTKHYG